MMLVSISLFADSKMYIYHTEDNGSVEFYDCIYARNLLYCRRPKKPIYLARDNDSASCESNGGIIHFFPDLASSSEFNISVILHQWKSGLERVEQYLRYLSNSNESSGYLCQCSDSQSFGKNCEYRLPLGTSIDEILEWQLRMKSQSQSAAASYGSIVCYETYQCDSGLLCLDWREICDGIQNCMYGIDEKNCDILELNQCQTDEYRCMNGMCIPDQYFLDGEFDCLDWSDEIQFKNDEDCASEEPHTYCDDRICRSKEWSCGDGQCIPNRLDFQQVSAKIECRSLRDQYFLCESHGVNIQWTLPNGRCWRKSAYPEAFNSNQTEAEQCQYLLRCAQSLGAGAHCPCQRSYPCVDALNRNCSLNIIQYPSGPIMAPYILFFYNHTRDWTNSWQDWMLINGTVLCRGMPTQITRTISFRPEWNVSWIVENIFCRSSSGTVSSQSVEIAQQCHRPSESTNLCNESNPCMSVSRIKDGFEHCLHGTDEKTMMDISISCSGLQRHRFRCSLDQPSCLSVMALGDQTTHCRNKFDEFWLGSDRRLSEMKCNDRQTDDCAALRQYIEQSWIFTKINKISTDFRIPFRFYCNTFWNIMSKEDENLHDCRIWWRCPETQWQCRTGQCIDRTWVEDNDWDCADASDEGQTLYNRSRILQQKHGLNSLTDDIGVRLGICNGTHPFSCFSVHPPHEKVACISLDQIGDEKIDCLGAIDERNLLNHCSEPMMLGNYFHCQSSNECITHWRHCHTHRCSNLTDDHQWCSLRNKSSDCSLTNDFICFNGSCAKQGRCNNEFNCPIDEDEYMCDYPSALAWRFIPYRQRKESNTRGFDYFSIRAMHLSPNTILQRLKNNRKQMLGAKTSRQSQPMCAIVESVYSYRIVRSFVFALHTITVKDANTIAIG